MDFTTILDFLMSPVTKTQVQGLFTRLSISGYSDFHVFCVWLFISIIVDVAIVIGTFKVIRGIYRGIERGFDL